MTTNPTDDRLPPMVRFYGSPTDAELNKIEAAPLFDTLGPDQTFEALHWLVNRIARVWPSFESACSELSSIVGASEETTQLWAVDYLWVTASGKTGVDLARVVSGLELWDKII